LLNGIGIALSLVITLSFSSNSLGGQGRTAKSSKMETYDDLLIRVEGKAPGFGGMFTAEDGQLVVYLLDPSTIDLARSAIESIFGHSIVPAAGVRSSRGRYTVSQLKRWADRATELLAKPGVVAVDLDEARNRVTIGIEGTANKTAVSKALHSLGIPPEAILLKEMDPVRQLNRPQTKGTQPAQVQPQTASPRK